MKNEPCEPCCDYCRHYWDIGFDYFAGHGECLLRNEPAFAHGSCEDFECAVCGSDYDTKNMFKFLLQ